MTAITMLGMQLIAVATVIQAISTPCWYQALSLYSLQDSNLKVFKTVAHWAWMKLLAAVANNHMKKSHSVCLSDLDASQWGHIRKNAGA